MAKAAKKPTKLELRAAAIAACKDRNGRITPAAVVRAARDPKNPLHNEFTWDLEKAAQREWLRTAAELIRSVKFFIVYEDRKIIAPYYVSDPREDGSGYIQTITVAKSGAMKRRVLQDELVRIQQALRRALSLAAAFNLVESFEQMLEDALTIEKKLGDSA